MKLPIMQFVNTLDLSSLLGVFPFWRVLHANESTDSVN